VREEDIKNFPCEDLLTLDRLWVEYSKKYGFEFGFSVQKDIYVECGGNLDFSLPSPETWNKFCDRIAWEKEGEWVSYQAFREENNYLNVIGHLPMSGEDGRRGDGDFFSRIATCEVQTIKLSHLY
jgi:hypothetical protein